MATIAGVSFTTVFAKATDSSKVQPARFSVLNSPWNRSAAQFRNGRMYVRPVSAAPDKLTDKVEQSIEEAQKACADDPVSGECAAAWDEVEELSAAVSHAKDKAKGEDALENYCKDNMDADECRTYED